MAAEPFSIQGNETLTLDWMYNATTHGFNATTPGYNATISGHNNSDLCTLSKGRPLPIALTVLQGCMIVVLLVANLVVNSLFTVVVITDKTLRRQHDLMLSTLLCVWNMIIELVYVTHFTTLITGSWVLGKLACYVMGNITFFIGLQRYVTILAIAVDRFGVIMHPFKYPHHAKKVIALVLALGSVWSLMVTVSFDIKGTFGCYNFDQSLHICFIQLNCKTIGCYLFVSLNEFVLAFFGIIIPLILYAIMFYKAKKVRDSFRVTCGSLAQVNGSSVTASSAESPVIPLQPLLTGLLIVLSVIILTLPSDIYIFLRTIYIDNSVMKYSPFAAVCANLHYIVPVLDGLLVMRNTDVKSRLAAMFRKLCCRAVHKNYLNA